MPTTSTIPEPRDLADDDLGDPRSTSTPSGIPGPPGHPPAYDQILSAIFFTAPFAALAALVATGRGVPWMAIVLTALSIVVLGHAITVGYHRCFAHRSFVPVRWLKITLAVLGTMAFQGSVITWVAVHRRHHRYTDRPGDPHSTVWKGDRPIRGAAGLWHAHVGWCFTVDPTSKEHYAADLLADRDLVLIDRLFLPLSIATFAVPFAIGLAWSGTWSGAVTALLCAGFVRIGIQLNGTWAVNSVCHRFGKRSFATRDVSTNFAPLAVLTMGEAWHNNHHAFPRSARHGLGRGQVDSSARLIRWLEQLGWVRDVQWPDHDQVEARLARAA